ncbi:MAG: glycerophosphodiester phosphodiesterase family protein, partial [Flavobacteriaceae bacterium]|nr:glycerophosphodiester phosphodiesterase family protein [Flavobacteriaceae bacterium]
MLKNLIVFFVIFFNTFITFSQQKKSSYNYSNCDFQAIGHRGYSDNYPENTLLSIEESFKRGVKYCEIDV